MKTTVYKKFMKLIGKKGTEIEEVPGKMTYIDPAHVMIVRYCLEGHGSDPLPEDQERLDRQFRNIVHGAKDVTIVHIPLEYLKKALEPMTGECVHLRISTDYPLSLLGNCDGAELEVLIAPRIEPEDGEDEPEDDDDGQQ